MTIYDDDLPLPDALPEEDPQEDNLSPELLYSDKITSKVKKEKKKISVARHGARNQNRHRVFVKWILETFPQEVQLSTIHPHSHSCSSNNPIDTAETIMDSNDPPKLFLVDIAGGKGELTLRLSICHSIQTILIDPRKEDLIQCFDKNVFKSLPKKWQESITTQRLVDDQFLTKRLQQRTYHIQQHFHKDLVVETSSQLHWAIQHASVLLGLHADGATEDIIDVALKYRIPFVVVPCCVFPSFTPTPRWLYVKKDTANSHTASSSLDNMDKVLVRDYSQFCEYLVQKDSHFQSTTLNFDGRNIAIWWDGKCSDQDIADGQDKNHTCSN